MQLFQAVRELRRLDRGDLAPRLRGRRRSTGLCRRRSAGRRPGRSFPGASGRSKPAAPTPAGRRELVFQRNVGGVQQQGDLRPLRRRRHFAAAESPGGPVGPLQAVDRPVVVDHRQRAADVGQREGESLVAKPAAVDVEDEPLMKRLVRRLPPQMVMKRADRAAEIERADDGVAPARAWRRRASRPGAGLRP